MNELDKLRLEREIKKVTSKNKILEEFDKLQKLKGFGVGTRVAKLRCLNKFAREIKKELDQVTKKDIQDYMAEWTFKENTQIMYKSHLKQLYTWMGKEELIDWIEIKRHRRNKTLPEDLLTKDDIKRLIKAADNYRDKAIIMMLYESAARKGELLGLRIKDCVFDKFGMVIVVSGKTGTRRIRLRDSEPFIKDWLKNHPFKDDPNAALFINLSNNNTYGKQYGIVGFHRNLKKITKRAGIRKNVHPHLFRHSRLTELAKYMTEQELKIFAGWVGASNMAEVYVHLSGKDMDRKMLEIYGIKEEQKREESKETQPVKCPRCQFNENSFESVFCNRCGFVLNTREGLKMQEIKSKVIDTSITTKNPISKDLVKEVLKEMIKAGEIKI